MSDSFAILAREAAQAEWVLALLRKSPDASCEPVRELIEVVADLHADALRRLEAVTPQRRLDA